MSSIVPLFFLLLMPISLGCFSWFLNQTVMHLKFQEPCKKFVVLSIACVCISLFSAVMLDNYVQQQPYTIQKETYTNHDHNNDLDNSNTVYTLPDGRRIIIEEH